MYLEENLDEKVALSDIPETGLARFATTIYISASN